MADILVRELAARVASVPSDSWTDDLARREGERFAWASILIAAHMKHPKFADEREWRIVSVLPSTDGIGFRESKSLLKPYVAIPLDPGDNVINDLGVVVGPSPHPLLAMRAAALLLATSQGGVGPRKILERVTWSSIPYRDW